MHDIIFTIGISEFISQSDHTTLKGVSCIFTNKNFSELNGTISCLSVAVIEYFHLQKEPEKTERKKTEEEQRKAEEVVKQVLKAITKAKAEAPKADSTVTVR